MHSLDIENPASAGFFVAPIFARMKRRLWKTWEALAVAANLAFTWLYIAQNPSAFLFGIIGPLMLLVLALRASIYADAFLQLVYAALALYGWFQLDAAWTPQVWSVSAHVALLFCTACAAGVSGFVLKKFTTNALPYLDAAITCFALSGTWLMMHLVHENWLYLMAVNVASAVLYVRRKLYIGAAMFLVYLLMAFDGYFHLGIFS